MARKQRAAAGGGGRGRRAAAVDGLRAASAGRLRRSFRCRRRLGLRLPLPQAVADLHVQNGFQQEEARVSGRIGGREAPRQQRQPRRRRPNRRGRVRNCDGLGKGKATIVS